MSVVKQLHFTYFIHILIVFQKKQVLSRFPYKHISRLRNSISEWIYGRKYQFRDFNLYFTFMFLSNK